PCTAYVRSRTPLSSRSRRLSSKTSSGSRTSTGARARHNLDTSLLRFLPMESLTVGQAATRTGWSPRMLRYLERAGLVIPARNPSGYRQYGLLELNQLRSLNELRRRLDDGIDELAFTVRLQQEPALQAAVETWLAGTQLSEIGRAS